VGAVTDSETGEEAAAGAIVVTLYQLGRAWVSQNTNWQLGRYRPFGRFYRGTYVGRYLGYLKAVRRRRLHGLGAMTPPRYRAGTRVATVMRNRISPFKLNRARRLRGLGSVWPGMKLGAVRRARRLGNQWPNFKMGAVRRRRALGWVGPARTIKGLGRYLGSSRNSRRR
jgi:hypothetical protein